jgi:fructosamine-3-kinase
MMATISHEEIEQALSRATGVSVHVSRRTILGGGDVSEVSRLRTSAGTFVLKSHPRPPNQFFEAEAVCLRAIADTDTTLQVPSVLHVADRFIVLEDLGAGRPTADFDERLGRGLARVHRTTAPRYGFERDTFCGTTIQPNDWTTSWIEFYGQARLGHQLEIASRAGLLSPDESASVDRLVARLDRLITEPTAASLVHGDLWSGNVHSTAAGMPAVIDPSAYFGHREAELGMMTLFGSFPSRVYDAYHEEYPLDRGWRERNPIYQLYHLMNHLNLFGAGYRNQVMQIVRRYL